MSFNPLLGTFFRSIGAVLGFTPEHGSLIGKENQNNYKFSIADEQKIIDWIITEQDLNIIEGNLIKQ